LLQQRKLGAQKQRALLRHVASEPIGKGQKGSFDKQHHFGIHVELLMVNEKTIRKKYWFLVYDLAVIENQVFSVYRCMRQETSSTQSLASIICHLMWNCLVLDTSC